MSNANLTVNGLPPREGLALRCIALGLTAKQAAKEMHCSPRNVEALTSNAVHRLHAKNRTHAVAQAFKMGHLKYIPVFLLCLITAISGADERVVRRGGRGRTNIVRIREVA